VVLAIVIVGALMYQLEGEANGFTSIPTAMYWHGDDGGLRRHLTKDR
jgi:hypothetical protein